MSAYTVLAGDTFDSISRSLFGTDEDAARIIAANPGATNPPVEGSTLFIPLSETPTPPADAEPGELAVVVDGKRFIGWTEVVFSRAVDAFGQFSLASVWEPANLAFREIFKPFGYQSVAIFEGEELLFNGTMIDVAPTVAPKSSTVVANGYALPGVINDCTPPISALPLESDEQDIFQVAQALLFPFGLTVEIDGETGPAFQREAIKSTDKILQYLIKLTKQRKLVITDTPAGACKLQTETEVGSPVAVYEEGQPGIPKITPQFSPQDYYSHVSGQGFTLFGDPNAFPGSTFTVANTQLQGVLRPFNFSAPDAFGGDLKAAVEAKAGRMFANAVSYMVDVTSWRDPQGALWAPNTTIKLTDPRAMIYEPYEFLIREVRYRRTKKAETATLILVLPGAFNGQIPEAVPWQTS